MTARFHRRGAGEALDVRTLVDEHLGSGRPTGWFEPLYLAAGRDVGGVPWARARPHPYLLDWLAEPVASPPGRRAAVVGTGLGDDAAELSRRGFEVVAFDVSPAAIAWARSRFPDEAVQWRVADLLELPADLLGAFDLVVEIHTVPSLPGVVRDAAMDAVGRLAGPRGVVLAVTLVAADADTARGWEGPPWAQAPSELAAYRSSGLVRLALEHRQPDESGGMEVRLTLQRPDGTPPSGTEPIGGAGGLPVVD